VFELIGIRQLESVRGSGYTPAPHWWTTYVLVNGVGTRDPASMPNPEWNQLFDLISHSWRAYHSLMGWAEDPYDYSILKVSPQYQNQRCAWDIAFRTRVSSQWDVVMEVRRVEGP
jgi:hypothetical protein